MVNNIKWAYKNWILKMGRLLNGYSLTDEQLDLILHTEKYVHKWLGAVNMKGAI